MSRRFQTTRWSLVVSGRNGSPESRQALEQLCELYWQPLFLFLRRKGTTPEAAEDLVQGFFARLMEKDYLDQADRNRGRFRSYLLAALKHYVSDERRRAGARKRSPEGKLLSLDIEDAEFKFRDAVANAQTPEEIYQRRWADTVVQRTLASLEMQETEKGRAEVFHLLKGRLTELDHSDSYQNIASQLGLTVSGVKSAVLRLRRGFGECLREEVAQTVVDPDEVEDEIRRLLSALA